MTRVRDWVGSDGRNTFGSLDFYLGVVTAAGSFVGLAISSGLRDGAGRLLIAEAAMGITILAVVLTALSILVAFLNENYLYLIRKSRGSIAAAIAPYRTLSVVGGTATIFALVGLFVWPVAPTLVKAALFGLASGFSMWALVGTIQLVGITARHGQLRARMPEIRESAERAIEQRRREAS